MPAAKQISTPESEPAAVAYPSPLTSAHGNSVLAVATRGILGLSRMGVLLLMARHYGKSIFGEVALAMSVLEIFRMFSEFGIDTISIHSFATDDERSATDRLGVVLGTKVVLAGAFYCVALAVLSSLATNARQITFGAVATVSLFSANMVGSFISFSQARFAMLRVFLSSALTASVYVGVATLLLLRDARPVTILAVLPLAEFVNAAILYLSNPERVRLRFSLHEAVLLLRQSLPIGLMAALMMIYVRLDNIVLFRFSGEAALGIYAAAFRIVEPALMIPQAFSTTLYATLSKMQSKLRGAALARIVRRTMLPSYLFIALASVVAFTVGPRLWRDVFPGYGDVASLLRILLLVLLLRTCNVTSAAILYSRRQYFVLTKIAASTLVVNFAAVMYLVPRFGLIGAVSAGVITEFWNGVLQYWNVMQPAGEPERVVVSSPTDV